MLDLSSARFASNVHIIHKMEMRSGAKSGQKVKCLLITDIAGSQNNGTATLTSSTPQSDADTTASAHDAGIYCTYVGTKSNLTYSKTSDTLTVCESGTSTCTNYK